MGIKVSVEHDAREGAFLLTVRTDDGRKMQNAISDKALDVAVDLPSMVGRVASNMSAALSLNSVDDKLLREYISNGLAPRLVTGILPPPQSSAPWKKVSIPSFSVQAIEEAYEREEDYESAKKRLKESIKKELNAMIEAGEISPGVLNDHGFQGGDGI